nr:MAG TPA: hypothetical protein [Caudoviricetes sp.]
MTDTLDTFCQNFSLLFLYSLFLHINCHNQLSRTTKSRRV